MNCPNKYCRGKYSNFNSQYWQIYIVKTNIVETNIVEANIKTMSKNTWRSSTARTSLRPDVSGLKSTFTSFSSLETGLDLEKSQEWVLRIQLKTKFCIFNWKKTKFCIFDWIEKKTEVFRQKHVLRGKFNRIPECWGGKKCWGFFWLETKVLRQNKSLRKKFVV